MTLSAPRQTTITRPGEPVWEIAELFPEQGSWTEQQYLALNTNRLVEFDNGTIEILPVPTKTHQRIVLFLFEVLKAFITARGLGGLVLVAPYRLRIPAVSRHREPDVLYMTAEQDARAGEDFTDAADLVAEVVSADDPDRDYVTKRGDYARAGVPEYWIIDRAARQVLVLRLDPSSGQYAEHGRFGPGQQATSPRLSGFAMAVDALLAPGR
jgi:Uma2 family endonuclease